MRLWCVMDLVTGQDGKLVMTKLQAATFHFLLAATVAYVTFTKAAFLVEMWALYAAVAVGHAVIDKTSAQLKDFKEKQLENRTGTAAEGS